VARGNGRDVVVTRLPQPVRHFASCRLLGQHAQGNRDATSLVQCVLVAELAVEERDAREALNRSTFTRGAFVQHLEGGADQTSVPVRRVGRHDVRTRDRHDDPLELPLFLQVERAGDDPVLRLAGVLDHDHVLGPHGRVVASHASPHSVREPVVRRVLTATEHQTVQQGNVLGVLCRRPAKHEAITKIASHLAPPSGRARMTMRAGADRLGTVGDVPAFDPFFQPQ
jgi:hypothetical protein